MPKRIQRKRTKGWKMPEGAVYVGRPTQFGNPFSHLARFSSVADSLIAFRMLCDGIWEPVKLSHVGDGPFHIACQDFAEYSAQTFVDGYKSAAQLYLRGKDLCCWCPLDQPCHADVLLEIANS